MNPKNYLLLLGARPSSIVLLTSCLHRENETSVIGRHVARNVYPPFIHERCFEIKEKRTSSLLSARTEDPLRLGFFVFPYRDASFFSLGNLIVKNESNAGGSGS